jgi:hypothetical protein
MLYADAKGENRIMENTSNENENKPYRCNLTDCYHIEDLDSVDYVDSIEDGEFMDVPYSTYEWKGTFSGVPTTNLYWDNGEYAYMINNGKGMMFYFNMDNIYHPTDPIAVTEEYYRHLNMWENKQYDKLFEAGVPEDFQNNWFKDCVRDMPLKMVYPIFEQIYLNPSIDSYEKDIQELIKESEKLQ